MAAFFLDSYTRFDNQLSLIKYLNIYSYMKKVPHPTFVVLFHQTSENLQNILIRQLFVTSSTFWKSSAFQGLLMPVSSHFG